MTKGPLGLSGDEYWNIPHARVEDAIGFPDAPQLVADIPSQVDLHARSTVPLVVSIFDSTYHSWLFSETRCGTIVAVNLDTGNVLSGELKPSEGPREEISLSYRPTPGSTGSLHVVDLKDILSLPGRPSRWVVRVIVHDRVSAPVRTELVDRMATPSLEEPPPPSPESSWLTYPPQPLPTAEIGLTLDVPAVVSPADDPQAQVSVHFSIPPLQYRQHDSLQGDDVVATVPVHIFFTGFLEPRGPLITVHVPIKRILATKDGTKLVSGQFSLNLSQLAGQGLDLREQDYQVYAFVGEYMKGPSKIQLGPKSLLPAAPAASIPQPVKF